MNVVTSLIRKKIYDIRKRAPFLPILRPPRTAFLVSQSSGTDFEIILPNWAEFFRITATVQVFYSTKQRCVYTATADTVIETDAVLLPLSGRKSAITFLDGSHSVFVRNYSATGYVCVEVWGSGDL